MSAALAPLRSAAFRGVWCAGLTANLCLWMGDTTAAWYMTTLTLDPLWVGMVQTASLLPLFLLGLPAGALADSIDRRRFLMFTQAWSGACAGAMAAGMALGVLTPAALLALVFASAIGLAWRMPVFAAVICQMAPAPQVPAAMALNSVSMNLARVGGPLAAGALIAALGPAWVLALNAALSLVTMAMVGVWTPKGSRPDRPEGLTTAVRVGVQFVRASPYLRAMLWRASSFFFFGVAGTALLPLVALRIGSADAGTFATLMACNGAGAVLGAVVLPRLQRRLGADRLVLAGSALLGVAWVSLAACRQPWLAAPVMLLAGAAWFASGNTLAVAAQLGFPGWLRGRGIALVQMAVMGGSAAGALAWGQVARGVGVGAALGVAAAGGIVAAALLHRRTAGRIAAPDLSPAPLVPPPGRPTAEGEIVVAIEYRPRPECFDAFVRLMLDEGRRSRLRHGALSWRLVQDVDDGAVLTELVTEPTWDDHLRHFDRQDRSDADLRERKAALLLDSATPRPRRHVALGGR